MRLLVAEDEPDMNELITNHLQKEGYAVDSCYDGETAWEYLSMTKYDGAILDIMMPKCDGLSLLGRLRERGYSVPVLFLTAKDSIEDRVIGLDYGANDYLVKPFSFQELSARIRAMIRSSGLSTGGTGKTLYQYEDLILNPATHKVERNGRMIDLSAKEFSILEALLLRQESVLSREQLIESVWNYDYEGASNMIDVYISRLRKKIDDNSDIKLIHTIRGVGYSLRKIKNKSELSCSIHVLSVCFSHPMNLRE